MKYVATHLMFIGTAEEAVRFYLDVFPGGSIDSIHHYGDEAGAMAGQVMRCDFRIGDAWFVAIDSPAKHDFTFTPSMSIFVECASLDELDGAVAALSEGGEQLMPPDDYGFSTRFCWLTDRFGVSWQLNFTRKDD